MAPRVNSGIISHLDPSWRSRWVSTVTFPVPPVIVKGTLYAEDCWRSDVLERGQEVFNTRLGSHRCMGAALTDRGPAFIIRYQLGEIFNTTYDFHFKASGPLFCARTSYATLIEAPGGKTYATDAIIEGVMAISASCHPASHTAVPLAPWLTLLLQIYRAEKVDGATLGFTFADDRVSREYFPEYDFSSNVQVDRFFQYTTVRDCLDDDDSTELKIFPTVSRGLLASLLPKLRSNERIHSNLPDPFKFVQSVDLRNQLIKEQSHGIQETN